MCSLTLNQVAAETKPFGGSTVIMIVRYCTFNLYFLTAPMQTGVNCFNPVSNNAIIIIIIINFITFIIIVIIIIIIICSSSISSNGSST